MSKDALEIITDIDRDTIECVGGLVDSITANCSIGDSGVIEACDSVQFKAVDIDR
jgi:hypothetical protein